MRVSMEGHDPAAKRSLAQIEPTASRLIIDLAKEAGVDVSDWANWKGGKARASTNPRYCYDWSFVEPGKVVVLNLWHEELVERDGVISRQLNAREWASRGVHPRKARALKMDQHIQTAYAGGLPIRVVVLAGTIRRSDSPSAKPSRATKRLLDPVPWAVTSYDIASGECTVTRGAVPNISTGLVLDDIFEGVEGKIREGFVRHRQREAEARKRKLEEAMRRNHGRVVCEVPNCGFDFVEVYGDLGAGYAQVHHKKPLSEAPTEGRNVTLDELAVVCANCHVMIHRGGECRPLEALIPGTTREKHSAANGGRGVLTPAS